MHPASLRRSSLANDEVRGARLDAAPSDTPAHAYWFGEDQARYLVTVATADAAAVIAKVQATGVPAHRIGTTGGTAVAISGERAMPVAALASGFEGWFPAYMAGDSARA